MDVTTEIRNKINQMGGSGSSRQAYLSSNKSLNFASGGNNLNTAPAQRVTAIPALLTFKGEVGLFGAENQFVKINLDVQSSKTAFANIEVPENTYFPVWTFVETATINDYETAIMDFTKDFVTENTYAPARISNDLASYGNPIVSVEIKNLKTGNQYLDNWLDIGIYDKNGNEIDKDFFYMSAEDYFFVGAHARNTRRIPINVTIDIGLEYYEKSKMSTAQLKLLL